MAQFIRVKNWAEYQHYKDRSAPWIKLHREILSGHFWVMGTDASKLLAICIMLLAQRTDNKIPLDHEYIKRFGHLENVPDLSGLVEAEFIEIIDENECLQDASKMLAMCTPYKRREEREGEEKKQAARARDVIAKPEDVDDVVWSDYLKLRKAKRAPVTATSIDETRKEAGKAGISLEDAFRVCCAKGWQGFKADWVRAPPLNSANDTRQAWLDELTGRNKRNAIESTARLVG